MSPKYSVVIPLYNSHPYVRRTIDSVLAQTISDFEVVVVDDGSPDPTGREIVRRIADPRIRLIVQENTGLSGARNRGIREARGEFVALLDGDDWWYPFHLQGADDFFRRNPSVKWYSSEVVGVQFPDEPPPLTYKPLFRLCTSYAGDTPGHSSGMVFGRLEMLSAGGFPVDMRKGEEDKIAYTRLAKLLPVAGAIAGLRSSTTIMKARLQGFQGSEVISLFGKMFTNDSGRLDSILRERRIIS